MKIAFEECVEALSVPAFYLAYKELGTKHRLWDKELDTIVDFFQSLSERNLKRVARAFGLQLVVTPEWGLEVYVGDLPGLLIVDTPVPLSARMPMKTQDIWECPCCGRFINAHFLEDSVIAAIAALYADKSRITKSVMQFCLVQPIEVCFPYSGKKQWHEADVMRILIEGVLGSKLGLEPILPPEKMRGLSDKLCDKYGFDIERWAETRARNIRQGIEPMPDLYGYKQV